MTEWVEQRIRVKFCIKLEHSSMETIWMIQKATAMGNWWLAASSRQCVLSCIIISGRVVWWNTKSSRWLSVLQPRFGGTQLLDFPQTKITSEREEISDHRWDSGKYNRAADGDWENCEVPRYLLWRGLWYHCPMHNVSCVCIFFSTCLYFSYYTAGYLLDRPHTTFCTKLW